MEISGFLRNFFYIAKDLIMLKTNEQVWFTSYSTCVTKTFCHSIKINTSNVISLYCSQDLKSMKMHKPVPLPQADTFGHYCTGMKKSSIFCDCSTTTDFQCILISPFTDLRMLKTTKQASTSS